MPEESSTQGRLDHFARLVQKTILVHQHPDTGLFPPNPNNPHAWIRDNVYVTLSIWGLSRAYARKTGMFSDDTRLFLHMQYRAYAYYLDMIIYPLTSDSSFFPDSAEGCQKILALEECVVKTMRLVHSSDAPPQLCCASNWFRSLNNLSSPI